MLSLCSLGTDDEFGISIKWAVSSEHSILSRRQLLHIHGRDSDRSCGPRQSERTKSEDKCWRNLLQFPCYSICKTSSGTSEVQGEFSVISFINI